MSEELKSAYEELLRQQEIERLAEQFKNGLEPTMDVNMGYKEEPC